MATGPIIAIIAGLFGILPLAALASNNHPVSAYLLIAASVAFPCTAIWLKRLMYELTRLQGLHTAIESLTGSADTLHGACAVLEQLCKAVVLARPDAVCAALVQDSNKDRARIAAVFSAHNGHNISTYELSSPGIDIASDSTLGRCLESNQTTVVTHDDLDSAIADAMPGYAHEYALLPVRCQELVSAILIVGTQGPISKSISHFQAIVEVAQAIASGTEYRCILQSNMQKLSSLSSTISALGPAATVPDITQAVVQIGSNALETDLFALFSIDPYTGQMDCDCTPDVTLELQSAFLDLYAGRITDRSMRDSWVVEDLSRSKLPNTTAPRILLDNNIRALVACPVRSEISAIGALVAFYPSPLKCPKDKLMLIEAVSAQASAAISFTMVIEQSRYLVDDLAGVNHELSQQATVDGLTGLANHRAFQQTLSEQCRKSLTNGRPFSLVMVDVDHFKIYNDTHGHQEGDAVLRRVAKAMTSGLRQGDLAARYGGEEFALIFPRASKDAAFKAADRIRMSIAQQPYSKGAITVSMGIAEFPTDGNNPTELIERADRALYHAKVTGRNRVFVWGSATSVQVTKDDQNRQAGGTTVLVVEDVNQSSVTEIEEHLVASGCRVDTASSVSEATELLRTRVFDIAIINMEALPDRDVKSLSIFSAMHPHMPMILLADALPIEVSREALRRGASDILFRPYNITELPMVIERNLERHRLELQRLLQKSTGIMLQAIEALVAAIDAKDHYTAGHSQRVASLSLAIAEELNLSSEERYALELAAKLHDIGKLALPDSALNKQSPLSEDEWRAMREHPVIGARIVGEIDELAFVSTIVRHHHERLDGTGYPDGLRGPAIPYLARIIAVADAYEAMTSERAHRSRLTPAEAIEELARHADIYYSAEVVEVLKKQLIARGEIRSAA